MTLAWFWTCFWYVWFRGTGAAVMGRCGTLAVLRISALLSVRTASTSGLLWFHHKQEASYTTPLGLFFGGCFGFFLFVAVVSGVPAVLGGWKAGSATSCEEGGALSYRERR